MKTIAKYIMVALLPYICMTACSDKEPEVPHSISITTGTPDVIEQSGGNVIVQFTSAREWTATSGQSWCKVSPSSGSAGTVTLTISAEENLTPDERNSSITIRSGQLSENVTIRQKQKDALTVTSNKAEVKAEGGTVQIEVKSNVEYTYEIEESAREWITAASSRVLTTSSIALNVTKNNSFDKREGRITIKSADLTETVTVYQAGEEKAIVLSQNEYTVGSEGETITIEIKSNIDYEMTLPADADWLKEVESRAVSTYTHHLSVAPNETYGARTTEVHFTNQTEGIDEVVKITQVQNDAIVVAQNEYTLDAVTTELTFDINTNIDFEVSLSVDWIEQQTESRALQTYPLAFVIQENATTEQREGTITIAGNGLEQQIKVVQKGRVDFSRVNIVHTNWNMLVPTITGRNMYGTVLWGDNSQEEYQPNAVHQYNQEGKWTLTIESWGSQRIELEDIVGIVEIDLTEF